MRTVFAKRLRASVCGWRFALCCAALLAALGPSGAAQAAIAFRAAAQASSAAGQAAPAFQAAGTEVSGTGAVNPPWPAHQVNDVALLFVESTGGQAATLSIPAGFAAVANSPQATGAGLAGTRITVFWARATSTTMPTPRVADPGNHVYARILTYRGVIATGNPWDVTGGGVKAAASTSVTVTGVTTTMPNTRVVQAVARDNDSAAAAFSAQTNANLTGITERSDAGTTAGNGGGIGIWDGVKATAGATGNTTATVTNSINAFLTIALRPPDSALTINVPAGTAANDVMIASITYRPCSNVSGGACTTTITPPAGWTQVNSVTDQTTGAGTGGFGNRLFVYRRVATGAEPASYTWTFGGEVVHAGAAGGIVSFSGVDTASPIVAEGGQTTASSVNHAAPSINTGAVTNTMLVSSHTANSSASWTPPAGMTERVDAASLAVPNNLGLSIEVNHEIFAGPGATGTRTASWVSPPAADTGITHMLALRPAVDHLAISHSGSGVTCAPESVTISAHDAAHGVVTGYTGTITLSTSTGRGDWSLITGGGVFSNGAVNDGIATYTFVAGDGGQAVLGLKDTVAETVNINVTDGTVSETSGSALASEDQNLTFATSAFRITDGAGNPASIATQTAGVTSATYGLQAIRTDTGTGACVGVFTGLVANIDLASECNNPTTCQAGQQVTFTNNGSGTIASNPNGSVTSYTARTLNFGANSEAQFTLSYPDVGAIKLHARYNIPLGDGSPSGNFMSGASNSFVVKPFGFTVSNIKRTSDSFANPGALDASGAIFIKAGDDFTVTVRATNSGGSATPNYGKETTPEGVLLAPSLVAGLGLTANPAITNGAIAGGEFGAGGAVVDPNGEATVTNLAWGEVGIITLTPSVADGDYLGAGDVTGTATGNVGRFTPFDLNVATNSPQFATGCGAGGFTYIGQKFNYATPPAITVTARNKSGATTQNYKGTAPAASAWFKITNASLTAKTYAAAAGSLDTSLIGSPDPVITDNGNGTGTLTFGSGGGIAFTRSTPVAPFDADIALSINVIDSDGIAFAGNPAAFGAATPGNGIAFSSGKQMRFGRLKLSNAYGSSLIDLPVRMETQYWNGTAFAANTLDSCTTLALSDVVLGNYQKNLNACETILSPAISFLMGVASPKLTKPGSANNGSVDWTVNLGSTATGNTCLAVGGAESAATAANRPYLQGKWSGANYDQNPTARATFGVHKGASEFIYLRENY